MNTVPSRKDILTDKLMQAAMAARELYRRGKAYGPDANISFMLDGRVYITRRDCPLRRTGTKDFACVTASGKPMNNVPACDELPLHLEMYRKHSDVGAVIHAHSTYATIWSCLGEDIPAHTAHLQNWADKIYLLENHGAIIGGKDVMDALWGLCQLEESAKLAWIFREGTL